MAVVFNHLSIGIYLYAAPSNSAIWTQTRTNPPRPPSRLQCRFVPHSPKRATKDNNQLWSLHHNRRLSCTSSQRTDKLDNKSSRFQLVQTTQKCSTSTTTKETTRNWPVDSTSRALLLLPMLNKDRSSEEEVEEVDLAVAPLVVDLAVVPQVEDLSAVVAPVEVGMAAVDLAADSPPLVVVPSVADSLLVVVPSVAYPLEVHPAAVASMVESNITLKVMLYADFIIPVIHPLFED
ncbi:UNVERIFIED_CONTAM: hypothetical protein GTU68_057750 [Idotea baltica]|nr:hypothetical protein [Idotea baltica]